MGAGNDREYGVVDPEADEEPVPTVEPMTGIEPDAEAEAERTRTWGEAKPAPAARAAGDPKAGGA